MPPLFQDFDGWILAAEVLPKLVLILTIGLGLAAALWHSLTRPR